MDILQNLQGLYDQRVAELVKDDKAAHELLLAIDAIKVSRGGQASVSATLHVSANPRVRHKMPVDDAVLLAVGNGVQSPIEMLRFLEKQLGVRTTIASIRTRLSRMKKDGRVGHDSRGWVMPSEVSEGLPLNENELPAGTSEANTGSVEGASGVKPPTTPDPAMKGVSQCGKPPD